MTAPRVLRPFQYIDSSSTGKLELAAMAKARPTMNATFSFSNATPSTMATTPMQTVAILDTSNSVRWLTRPWATTLAYRSWLMAEAPDSVRPETTARMVANATAEMKPSSKLPPTAWDSQIAGMFAPPISLCVAASRYCGLVLTRATAPKPMMNVRM